MTLTQLEYIVAVDKYRHFGNAAKACFVTQPTLSMQLSKLEDELQVIIFDRSKTPIVPTLQGEPIIEQAKIVLRENKKINDIAEMGRNGVQGHFTLAVIPTLAPYILPLFVKKFSDKYPDVKLHIEERKTNEIVELLATDKIDAGILVTPLHNDAIIERVLYYEPFYLFCSPNHPLLDKETITDKDLKLDEMWLLEEGHCFRDQVLKLCKFANKKNTGTLPNVKFEGGNFETIKNMILATSGYTLLPEIAVEMLPECRLQYVREIKSNPPQTREVSLVHSRSFLKERIVDSLEREIIDNLPKSLKTLKSNEVSVVEIF